MFLAISRGIQGNGQDIAVPEFPGYEPISRYMAYHMLLGFKWLESEFSHPRTRGQIQINQEMNDERIPRFHTPD
jgi:hypothetical protein